MKKDTSHVTDQHQQFQLSLLRQESQLAWLHHRINGEMDARTIRREQDCGEIQSNGDETDKFFCHQFFIGGQSDCVEKFGDTQSFKLTGWIIREACGKGQGSEVCETAGRLCHQHRGSGS